MILYDQNFKFIGMSAETLTFLGYEDLDEFCSMHNDFADLFIKREGYIHKFENFSWIHYILYSGAANKKALIDKKNGGELSVEITIKEVFLNKTYDGLEKIYSVKLINENFTAISRTDVHDQRSHQNSHFSLQNLTKNFNTPKENGQTDDSGDSAKESTILPQPLLNIEKEFTQEAKKEEPQINMPEHSGFILGSFDETSKTLDETKDVVQNAQKSELDSENTVLSLEIEENENQKEQENELFENFKNGFLLSTSDEQTPKSQDENEDLSQEIRTNEQNETSNKEPEAFELNFDLFEKEQNDEQKESDDTINLQEEKEAENIKAGFLNEQEEDNRTNILNISNQQSPEEEKSQKSSFSLELFEIQKNETSEQKEPEDLVQDATDDGTKESLISRIKSDIKEIDEEIKPKPQEKEAATLELKELLRSHSTDENSDKEKVSKDEDLIQERPEKNDFSFSEEDLKVEKPKSEKEDQNSNEQDGVLDFLKNDKKSDDDEKDEFKTLETNSNISKNSYQDSSFEETLKDIFTSSSKNEDTKNTPNTDKSGDNHLTFTLLGSDENNDDKIAQNQQSINKEPIKSDDDIKSSPKMKTKVSLPPLGSLGLSKEEELDFIDEFLNDTVSTISLIEEYIKIDDFDNIKYSLIKIKSSAEILGFDAMIDVVKSLTDSCDMKEKAAIIEKLKELKEDTTIYREHFAAIAV